MAAKTLMIGLDGAEPRLLQQWAAQGHLPNLKTLVDSWYCRDIQTPPGFGDGVFWATLITGVNAGKHGHFFPKHFNPDTYQIYDFNLDTDFAREPFWLYLSGAGARVAVIDLYTSPLVSGLNGIQVMDWMIHHATGNPRSWPTRLIDHLHQQYMADPLEGDSDVYSRTESEQQQFQTDLLQRVSHKTAACTELLKENEWDLFCVGYCDAHDSGHQSWDVPGDDTDITANRDCLWETYRALDTAVGQLLDTANADNVFLIAGLGMERQHPYNAIMQLTLGHYCGVTGDRQYVTDQRMQMPYFEMPHNMNSGALRINLQGREAQGIVPESEYQATVDMLADRLGTLSCADTGQCIVEKIVKVHETFHGNYLHRLPDLFVVWNKSVVTDRVNIGDGTVVDVVPFSRPEMRKGDHSDRALFVSSGNFHDEVVATEAIAPTICRSLGYNLPDTDAAALHAK